MPRSASAVGLARRGVIPRKQFYIKMSLFNTVILGISDAGTRRWLAILRDEGRIIATAPNPRFAERQVPSSNEGPVNEVCLWLLRHAYVAAAARSISRSRSHLACITRRLPSET